jgi:hypothetical protein
LGRLDVTCPDLHCSIGETVLARHLGAKQDVLPRGQLSVSIHRNDREVDPAPARNIRAVDDTPTCSGVEGAYDLSA